MSAVEIFVVSFCVAFIVKNQRVRAVLAEVTKRVPRGS